MLHELVPRLVDLARRRKAADIGFTIDAEEAERLDLIPRRDRGALATTSLTGWDGFGLAVQAYQKRALP